MATQAETRFNDYVVKDLGLAEQTYRGALKKFDRPGLAVRTHSILEAAGSGLDRLVLENFVVSKTSP